MNQNTKIELLKKLHEDWKRKNLGWTKKDWRPENPVRKSKSTAPTLSHRVADEDEDPLDTDWEEDGEGEELAADKE